MIGALLNTPKPTTAEIKVRAADQARINDIFRAQGEVAAIAEILVRVKVEGRVADPVSGWLLGTSLAVQERGHTVYARPGDQLLLCQDLAGVVSFYSVRVAHLCIAGGGIKPLVGWDQAFEYWREQWGKGPVTWIVEPPDDEQVPPVELWLPPAEAKEEP